MKRFALATALLLSVPLAHAAPPTAAQVDRLLEVTDAQKMMDGMLAQMEQATRQMGQSMLGADASAEQRAKFERVMAEQHAVLRRMLAADRLQPIYRKVYAEVFTAEEVKAMTDFYSSPTGQRILEKMPQVMGRAMQEMQPLMREAMQEVQQSLQRELGTPPPADAPSN